MDHPNIDLVRRAYAAYLSGDRPTIDAVFSWDLIQEAYSRDIEPLFPESESA